MLSAICWYSRVYNPALVDSIEGFCLLLFFVAGQHVKVPDNELIQDEFLLSEGKDLFIFLDLVPVQVHNC